MDAHQPSPVSSLWPSSRALTLTALALGGILLTSVLFAGVQSKDGKSATSEAEIIEKGDALWAVATSQGRQICKHYDRASRDFVTCLEVSNKRDGVKP